MGFGCGQGQSVTSLAGQRTEGAGAYKELNLVEWGQSSKVIGLILGSEDGMGAVASRRVWQVCLAGSVLDWTCGERRVGSSG